MSKWVIFSEILNLLFMCFNVVIGLIVINKQRNTGGLLIFLGLLLQPLEYFVILGIGISLSHLNLLHAVHYVNLALYLGLLITGALLLPRDQ